MSDLLLVSSIAESDAIKKLLAELNREVQETDAFLVVADSKKLPDFDRDLLLAQKAIYKRVLSYFDTARLKQLESEFDDNLRKAQ